MKQYDPLGEEIRIGGAEALADVDDEEIMSDDERPMHHRDPPKSYPLNSTSDSIHVDMNSAYPVTSSSRDAAPERSLHHDLLAPNKSIFFDKTMLLSILFIFLWYILATFLSMYNKYMFSHQHLGFRFPLLVTCVHQVIQLGWASLLLWLIPSLRPAKWMRPREYTVRVVPCGIATGMDIGLSNSSLKSITLSFYTMVKSSSLIFVLLFAFLFRLEKPRWALIGVICTISLGVLLMVANETNFVFVGFIEVLLASIMGGLRWSLTQLLLSPHPKSSSRPTDIHRRPSEDLSVSYSSLATPITPTFPQDSDDEDEEMPSESIKPVQRVDSHHSKASGHSGHQHPVTSILHLAPVMAISIFLAFMVLEYAKLRDSDWFATTWSSLVITGWMVLGGCVAFAMVAAEFEVIRRLGVVTLSVAGIFKEVLTILISCWYFGDVLHTLNIVGLVVTIIGIGAYNWLKMQERGGLSEANMDLQAPKGYHPTGLENEEGTTMDEDMDSIESDTAR